MKKFATILLILISLLALNIFCIRPIEAQNPNNISINADGSVTPSTTPLQRSGNTYTLTGSVFDSPIVVQRSDIVVDGGNYILQVRQTADFTHVAGINLTKVNNVIIKNFEVEGFGNGINIQNSSNCIIENNTITTTNGIALTGSSNNQIINNNITSNVDQFIKPQNIGISVVVDSSNNNVSKNKVAGSWWWIGIVTDGQNNTISSNKMTGMIDIAGSANKVFGNEVSNTATATSTQTFPNSGTAIGVSGNNQEIFQNTIRNNGIGIFVSGSGTSIIYLNNFINNTHQVSIEESAKAIWDDGSKGNFWSDYQSKYPNATEIDSSGIGNTPYVINEDNVDHYPLMNQVDITVTPMPTITPSPSVPEFSWLAILPLLLLTIFIANTLRHRKKANNFHPCF
jgi:parallel beta-helix repeat protein